MRSAGAVSIARERGIARNSVRRCLRGGQAAEQQTRPGAWTLGAEELTTNQTITQWGHVFGDDVIAAAVLDRVLHHSHVLVIQGDSFRLRQKKRAGLLGSNKAGH